MSKVSDKVAEKIKTNILYTVTSLLPLPPNPAEAVGFFGRKNPQHAFLRRGSKAVCPMSQICGM
jgi:hypothetical protein